MAIKDWFFGDLELWLISRFQFEVAVLFHIDQDRKCQLIYSGKEVTNTVIKAGLRPKCH